jgi:hypothetical protein
LDYGTKQHVLTNIMKEPAASSFKMCHKPEALKTLNIFPAAETSNLNRLKEATGPNYEAYSLNILGV